MEPTVKRLALALALQALCCVTSEAAALELVTGKEETQVFFIDARRLQADSATFRLTGADGAEVPFSFDLRWTSPEGAQPHYFNGRFVPRPNGIHSKRSAPAAEAAFTHPGWLSFRKRPGVDRYTLTYANGTPEAAQPRPNAAVRAWWIELMHDPGLHDPEALSSGKESVTALPGGGIEVNRSFRWKADAYTPDSRLKGRRLVAMFRSAGLAGNFTVPFHNPFLSRSGAINCYFENTTGAPIDVWVEGRVADHAGDLLRTPGDTLRMNLKKMKQPGQVYAFHLQSPPEEIPVTVKLNSSLYHLGDRLRITIDGLGYELLHPLAPELARLDRWEPEETSITATLKTPGGKTVKTFSGRHEIRLRGVPPGRYHLEVMLKSRRPIPETIARESFPIEIQNGPRWEKGTLAPEPHSDEK
ncbi:MAG TPA: hypothetical protein VNQ90_18590 [Chthoniobacteraceae bacterium]|nr:hypothetical protein [Chthoniobacteraceae bacterium]